MRSWRLDRVLKALEEEGRTRRWLASQCAVSPQMINHYLSGRRTPGRPVLRLLAQALHVSESYLLGEDDLSIQSQPEDFRFKATGS